MASVNTQIATMKYAVLTNADFVNFYSRYSSSLPLPLLCFLSLFHFFFFLYCDSSIHSFAAFFFSILFFYLIFSLGYVRLLACLSPFLSHYLLLQCDFHPRGRRNISNVFSMYRQCNMKQRTLFGCARSLFLFKVYTYYT